MLEALKQEVTVTQQVDSVTELLPPQAAQHSQFGNFQLKPDNWFVADTVLNPLTELHFLLHSSFPSPVSCCVTGIYPKIYSLC